MVIFTQMFVLFMLMLVGVIAYNKKILNPQANKSLAAIVVNIANPALILSSIVGDYESVSNQDLLLTVGVAIGMFTVLILLSYIVPKVVRVKREDAGVYGIMTIFSNIGFMGFPIISAVFGKEALLYASIFLLPYNLLIYTYGIQRMSSGGKKEKIQLSRILNMGVIASVITIILFLMKVQINEAFGKGITMLSDLTAPLSMMLIGASFAQANVKEMFMNKKLLIFSLIKQLIIPLMVGGIMMMIIPNAMIAGVTTIMLAAPVGSMCAMLAQSYNQDEELVSQGVVLTTLVSIVTIPVVVNLLVGSIG